MYTKLALKKISENEEGFPKQANNLDFCRCETFRGKVPQSATDKLSFLNYMLVFNFAVL